MKGYKTYAVSALMILHALGSYALGSQPQVDLTEVLTALGLSALRAGVAKGPGATTPVQLLAGLFTLGFLFTAPLQAQTEPDFDWVAPEPPLPNTQYWDYGWDSTSNGVPPEAGSLNVQRSTLNVERSTGLLASVTPIRLAQSRPLPPPPTIPVATPSAQPPALYAAPKPGRIYLDSGLSLSTRDFTDADYGYGVRLGYQVSKHWGFDVGVGHQGLDFDGSAVQSLGGRVVARLPFEFLSPYTFLGGRFDLERDTWTIEPGAGIEVGVSKALRGLSIYGEGKLKADIHGANNYGFEAGVRLRF